MSYLAPECRTSPFIRSLMKLMSSWSIWIPFCSTRSSNIISLASSCVHLTRGLQDGGCPSYPIVVIVKNEIKKMERSIATHKTAGMNSPSHTCDHGPCPKSWQRPAIVTQRISRSVIPSSGCRCLRRSTSMPARCATPTVPCKIVPVKISETYDQRYTKE